MKNNLLRAGTFACLLFLLFINISCGLDSFYVLEPPDDYGNRPTYNSSDYTKKFFSFRTEEKGTNDVYLSSSSEFKFSGTEIYYKIFKGYSIMHDVESRINEVNNSTYYTQAAERLISTYKYQQLKFSSGSFIPLVKATGNNQYVYIRLTDYNNEDFRQGICIGNIGVEKFNESMALKDGSGNLVLPRRNYGGNESLTFNFGGDDKDHDWVPHIKNFDGWTEETDIDVFDNSTENSEDENAWYVSMYAVSVGRDTTFTDSYSLLLHLGEVKIMVGEEN